MKKTPANLAKSDLVDSIPLACADERAALELFESQRWGDTPACVHCGSTGVYTIKDRASGERRTDGRWRCRDCGKQYTVRVGMVMEDSPIPLHKWAYAFWCAASAKNGVSALEMSRKIQVSYKSALYMMNRIRWAMRPSGPMPKLKGTVEADETYVGGKPREKAWHRGQHKSVRGWNTRISEKVPVVAVVRRGGNVRARVITRINLTNIGEYVAANVDASAHLRTDGAQHYEGIGKSFQSHESVNHRAGEYVRRGNADIHSNTVEGYFSRLKRTLVGTYHAVSKEHLHRYVDHAAFLYNGRNMNDGQRIAHLIRSADGKRLMYREAVKKAG